MSIREFLRRETERDMALAITPRQRAEALAKLEVLKFHEAWPTLIEGPLEIDPPTPSRGIDQLAFRASRQIAWKTEQEYIKRFGIEPPTTPILRALARVYFDRPGFREEWLR